MDVEKTMEFILEQQAQISANVALHGEMLVKSERRADKFEKNLDAIRKLIQIGMKMLVRAEARADRADARADRADARMDKLEASVKALVDLNRRGHNGKNGR